MSDCIHYNMSTGPRSAVVSWSDYRPGDGEFDLSPVPYLHGDNEIISMAILLF